MTTFNDYEYAILIANLLHDINYIKTSNMGKIAGLRKHAEVLVRKILNIGSDTHLMLGQVNENSRNLVVRERLDDLGNDLGKKLIDTVARIKMLGNEGTHSQRTTEFTDEEVAKVEDAILDLYALLFIKYFTEIRITIFSSPIVLHEFSILPPIIRYKTWSYLFERDKNNIQVANKLCLSIIKTFDKETAYKWLNDNREEIKKITYPNDYEKIHYIVTGGIEVEPGVYQVSLDFDKYENMYDLLYDKIKDSHTSINEAGKMYKTFEEAIEFYNNYKNTYCHNNSEEIEKFHSLMEFVYMGRKSKSEL